MKQATETVWLSDEDEKLLLTFDFKVFSVSKYSFSRDELMELSEAISVALGLHQKGEEA